MSDRWDSTCERCGAATRYGAHICASCSLEMAYERESKCLYCSKVLSYPAGICGGCLERREAGEVLKRKGE